MTCPAWVRVTIAPALGATYLRCTRTGPHRKHRAKVRWS